MLPMKRYKKVPEANSVAVSKCQLKLPTSWGTHFENRGETKSCRWINALLARCHRTNADEGDSNRKKKVKRWWNIERVDPDKKSQRKTSLVDHAWALELSSKVMKRPIAQRRIRGPSLIYTLHIHTLNQGHWPEKINIIARSCMRCMCLCRIIVTTHSINQSINQSNLSVSNLPKS